MNDGDDYNDNSTNEEIEQKFDDVTDLIENEYNECFILSNNENCQIHKV